MIKKCPKSDSGKHNWVVRGTPAKSTAGSNELDPPLWHWCNFCGVFKLRSTQIAGDDGQGRTAT